MLINPAAHCDTTVARMLVGNKCDLENIRDVSVEEGKSLAEEEDLFFMETSALESTNVQTAFEIVIREIYNNVSRKALNSDAYKAELSANRVTLVKDGSNSSKEGFSCCSRWSLFQFPIFLHSYLPSSTWLSMSVFGASHFWSCDSYKIKLHLYCTICTVTSPHSSVEKICLNWQVWQICITCIYLPSPPSLWHDEWFHIWETVYH